MSPRTHAQNSKLRWNMVTENEQRVVQNTCMPEAERNAVGKNFAELTNTQKARVCNYFHELLDEDDD